jgi:hypothetical protein
MAGAAGRRTRRADAQARARDEAAPVAMLGADLVRVRTDSGPPP